MGFEPTIPEFERTKAVHTLDLAATVMGRSTRSILHIMWDPMDWVEYTMEAYRIFVSNSCHMFIVFLCTYFNLFQISV
jgi:hypothetical protein